MLGHLHLIKLDSIGSLNHQTSCLVKLKFTLCKAHSGDMTREKLFADDSVYWAWLDLTCFNWHENMTGSECSDKNYHENSEMRWLDSYDSYHCVRVYKSDLFSSRGSSTICISNFTIKYSVRNVGACFSRFNLLLDLLMLNLPIQVNCSISLLFMVRHDHHRTKILLDRAWADLFFTVVCN